MSTAQPKPPGPWLVSKSLWDGSYGVLRFLDKPGDGVETLNDKRGRERRFKTEADAIAAISKATGK